MRGRKSTCVAIDRGMGGASLLLYILLFLPLVGLVRA